jgi:tetratricopeptide (TPR) repeat protein
VFNDFPRNDWSYAYTAIFYANVVLDGTSKYGKPNPEWQNIRGQASFFRGYAYYQLAQQFCKPYEEQRSASDLGIVLRDSPDPNAKSSRASVAKTYQQIISDLTTAIRLLPVSVLTKTRPGKAAAYAALARTYLSMRQYEKAGLYADSSLQLNAVLMDYNKIIPGSGPSFKRFNDEVLLHTIVVSTPLLLPVKYLVDTMLYTSYEANDLRRTLFFKALPGTAYVNFNGSYDGTTNLFNGPATDEMYLVRAEALARSGQIVLALADLNLLRKNRFKASSFVPLSSGDATEVLGWILTERRKELILRGGRWADLRRLNKEPAYAKILVKQINGQQYVLPPGDSRYVWPIPQEVIAGTGMPQN